MSCLKTLTVDLSVLTSGHLQPFISNCVRIVSEEASKLQTGSGLSQASQRPVEIRGANRGGSGRSALTTQLRWGVRSAPAQEYPIDL